jgi:hypothetical protein
MRRPPKHVLVASYPRSGTHLVINLVRQALQLEDLNRWRDVPVLSPRMFLAADDNVRAINAYIDQVNAYIDQVTFDTHCDCASCDKPVVWKTHHCPSIFRGKLFDAIIYVVRDPMDTLYSHWVFFHRRYELINVSFVDFCLHYPPRDLARGDWFQMIPPPANILERLWMHRQQWQMRPDVLVVNYDHLLRNPGVATTKVTEHLVGWPYPLILPGEPVGVNPYRGLSGSAKRHLPPEQYAEVFQAYRERAAR